MTLRIVICQRACSKNAHSHFSLPEFVAYEIGTYLFPPCCLSGERLLLFYLFFRLHWCRKIHDIIVDGRSPLQTFNSQQTGDLFAWAVCNADTSSMFIEVGENDSPDGF